VSFPATTIKSQSSLGAPCLPHMRSFPMQYEARRHCVTVLGWEDPRGLDKDGKSLLDCGGD